VKSSRDRSRPRAIATVLAALAFCSLVVAGQVRAEVRALVVALDYTESYDRNLALKNTMRDARAITDMLRGIRLRDVALIENPTSERWQSELDTFVGKLTDQDVGLLYYAGHAVQVGGRNYFLTADGATLVAAEQILAAVMAKARGSLFLIDACRDNPFRRQPAAGDPDFKVRGVGTGSTRALETISRSQLATTSNGLSQLGNLRGTDAIVLFSTDPGNVALDGDAGNGSPFANAVVRQFAVRQSLDSAIRRITAEVRERTGGQQSPWRQGDLSFPLFLAGRPPFPAP
jgi:uncharacterized caspase-like protein